MRTERLIWIVAVILVAAIGFFGGQYYGARDGMEGRAAAAQQFFSNRGQAGGQGGQGRGAAGTVTAVAGNTIAITTRNGQTLKIELAPNGIVRKQVDGAIGDVTVGTQIVAFGAQAGDVFQANTVQIGGFGGRGTPGQERGAQAQP